MIYLSFNSSHLLCTVWSYGKEKPILTHIVELHLPANFALARGDERLFKKLFNNIIESLTREISLDGQDIIVTIPDDWVHHNFMQGDLGLNKDDNWNIILWQKSLRYGPHSKEFSTYAEPVQNNFIHVIHIPTIFISSMKFSLIEYGALPVWFGTESMSFTGTQDRTFGIASNDQSGYHLFIVSNLLFFYGTARFIKGNWKVTHSFGFDDEISNLLNDKTSPSIESFNTIYPLDELSPLRQAHWSGFELNSIEIFKNGLIEVAETMDEYSHHLLTIQSILLDESFCRSGQNFFLPAGFNDDPINKESETQSEGREDEKSENVTQLPRVNRKLIKTKTAIVQRVVGFFTIVVIILAFIYSVYQNKTIETSIIPLSTEKTDVEVSHEIETIQSKYPSQLLGIMDQSQSMISAIEFIFANVDYKKITFLSTSNLDLQVEIVNGEEVKTDFTELGTMINYTVTGIDCCGGYKHFYEFQLPIIKSIDLGVQGTSASFEAVLNNMDVQVEKLIRKEKGAFTQTPFIIKGTSEQSRKDILELIKYHGENILIRKVIIKMDLEIGAPKTVFYVSVFERKNK